MDEFASPHKDRATMVRRGGAYTCKLTQKCSHAGLVAISSNQNIQAMLWCIYIRSISLLCIELKYESEGNSMALSNNYTREEQAR